MTVSFPLSPAEPFRRMNALPGHRAAPATTPGPVAAGTFLSPADPFPARLAELDVVELHVLHSRVRRQIDTDYLTDPEGPHPVTLDRCRELGAELDLRQLSPEPAEHEPAERGSSFPDRRGTAAAPSSERLPAADPGAAADPFLPVHDLEWIRPGDRVEVWERGLRRCTATVEEVAPALGVVWVREAGDGYRRMFHGRDVELRVRGAHPGL